jgi:CRP/FNR family transcriptional regulator, cyclic AMP receptor protein
VDSNELAVIPAFAAMPSEERQVFAGVCADLDVDAGTTLIHEGDFGYAMFAIKEGTADVLRGGTVVRNLGPGDVFGEIAVLAGGRRTATVVASAPMRLITVMNRDVWRLEREAPEVGASLRATIADCLGHEYQSS